MTMLLEAGSEFARGVAIHCPQTKSQNLSAAKWLGERVEGFNPDNVTCLVVTLNGEVVSVVGYSRPHFNRIEISWASSTPRWVTRSSILYCLAPPFLQWGYQGISCVTKKTNKRLRKFVEGIGFKYEGTLRRVGTDGGNFILYGLLEDEYGQLIKRYAGEAEYDKYVRATNG